MQCLAKGICDHDADDPAQRGNILLVVLRAHSVEESRSKTQVQEARSCVMVLPRSATCAYVHRLAR